MHPVGNASEATKFFQENDIEFSEGFVNCPSYEVIVAEAYAQLEKAFPDLCEPYHINYEAMLVGAIANSNERIEDDIKNAVSKMADNFGVNIKQVGHHKKTRHSDVFSMVNRVFVNLISPRPVAIERSMDVGVKNIDDAALVAYLLIEKQRKDMVTTSRDLIKEILKRRMGF